MFLLGLLGTKRTGMSSTLIFLEQKFFLLFKIFHSVQKTTVLQKSRFLKNFEIGNLKSTNKMQFRKKKIFCIRVLFLKLGHFKIQKMVRFL